MSENIVLKNGRISLTVSTLGAEIQSAEYNGRNYFYDGQTKYWSGRAPVLFPMCGGLTDDFFTYEGKEYKLNKHGFARHSEFASEMISESEAVFTLRDSESTLAVYPFKFELKVGYKLCENKIVITYSVANKDGKKMYFSIGSHEAYSCPDGVEPYEIVFDKEETLKAHKVVGNLLSEETTTIIENTRVLPLKNELFAIDALVFKKFDSKGALLRRKDGKEIVRVDFQDCPYLLVWTKPGAPFICIEPWNGIPPLLGSSHELCEKEGINSLDAGKTFDVTHTITLY